MAKIGIGTGLFAVEIATREEIVGVWPAAERERNPQNKQNKTQNVNRLAMFVSDIGPMAKDWRVI
jgi:hypothetical protein